MQEACSRSHYCSQLTWDSYNKCEIHTHITVMQQEQQTSLTTSYLDKVRQSWHTALPPPWCALFTLKSRAGAWPWQRATLASFPHSGPPPDPHVMGVIFGMLLMSVAWRNPFLLDAQPHFLEDSTSKMRHMEMSHTPVPQSWDTRTKVPCWQVQNRIWAGRLYVYCRCWNALRAVVAEKSDKRSEAAAVSHVSASSSK